MNDPRPLSDFDVEGNRERGVYGIGMRVRQCIEILDQNGSGDAPISVNATRATLMRHGFKPEKRGAPLMYGAHQILPEQAPAAADEEQTEINLEN